MGVQKYVYDVFGPAVSLASEARVMAEPMSIRLDGSIAGLIDQGEALGG